MHERGRCDRRADDAAAAAVRRTRGRRGLGTRGRARRSRVRPVDPPRRHAPGGRGRGSAVDGPAPIRGVRRPPGVPEPVRQARRHRREPPDRADARDLVDDQRRRQDGHVQAAAGRALSRRHAVQRGRRLLQLHPDAVRPEVSLVPQERTAARDESGRRGRLYDSARHEPAVQPAPVRADRPGRHDGVARGRRAGRARLRPQPGRHRPVPVRPAGHRGQHPPPAQPHVLAAGQAVPRRRAVQGVHGRQRAGHEHEVRRHRHRQPRPAAAGQDPRPGGGAAGRHVPPDRAQPDRLGDAGAQRDRGAVQQRSRSGRRSWRRSTSGCSPARCCRARPTRRTASSRTARRRTTGRGRSRPATSPPRRRSSRRAARRTAFAFTIVTPPGQAHLLGAAGDPVDGGRRRDPDQDRGGRGRRARPAARAVSRTRRPGSTGAADRIRTSTSTRS